ncbi:isochorismate synthase [Vibrio hippocampi]|uniref:isochorismate synthase n=1 Tax=Vibrio hippocampi TaxID=654686 RepID=UPI001F011DC5|nr:isochorismate synthase [Vibrio hippocampi]
MSQLKHVISQLIEQIKTAPTGVRRLELALSSAPTVGMIDWLEAQPHFPKFYWQTRDAREEVVALGQLHTFSDPAPAYTILAENQRVWGGRSFDGQTDKNPRCMSALFFLPQIELIRIDHQWYLAANIGLNKQVTIQALSQLIAETVELTPLSNEVVACHHTPERKQWQTLVDDALDNICAQKFEKVVLARKTEIHLSSSMTGAQFLKASVLANHNSFHFLMSLSKSHCFIGSTPERLYRRIDRDLETEALAGTIGRGDSASQDLELANWLTQDVKNVNENQYVVDDVITSLQPFSESVVVDNTCQLVRLRSVQHLKRSISAVLQPGINGVQLLKALQPTAAVAGLPRQQALEYIAQHEPFARGWYAGSVGYLSHKKAEFCVSIRSAMVSGRQCQLFAGAGIVPGSVAEHEWHELDKKMQTLLSLISDNPYLGVAS